jgi:hypothetical protein
MMDYESYLKEIEMPDSAVHRIKSLMREFDGLISEKFKNGSKLFVSDVFDDQSVRRYISFWMFSSNIAIEFKDFLQSDSIDYTNLCDLKYAEVNKKKIGDLTGEYSSKSEVNALLAFDYPMRAKLTAVSNNCKHLHAILSEYILPKIYDK